MTLRAAWAWSSLILLAAGLSAAVRAQTAPPVAANTDPKSVIVDCELRIREEKTGLSELEKDCPPLQAALEQAQLRALIIDSSRAVMDRHSLIQLRNLMHAGRSPAPPVAALRPILRGLKPAMATQRSWWQRVWDWLVEHLGPNRERRSSVPWLSNLLQVSAQLLWTAIMWSAVVALPIAVMIIAVREVRAMRGRSTGKRVRDHENAIAGPAQSRLALLHQVPLAQRPAKLFALLIGRLVAAGRLPPDRSLTHRELARRALLDDAEQRRLIEALARLCERQLYAGAPSVPEGLLELLARGEDLYITGWGRPVDLK